MFHHLSTRTRRVASPPLFSLRIRTSRELFHLPPPFLGAAKVFQFTTPRARQLRLSNLIYQLPANSPHSPASTFLFNICSPRHLLCPPSSLRCVAPPLPFSSSPGVSACWGTCYMFPSAMRGVTLCLNASLAATTGVLLLIDLLPRYSMVTRLKCWRIPPKSRAGF
jgi:hypothetical protein